MPRRSSGRAWSLPPPPRRSPPTPAISAIARPSRPLPPPPFATSDPSTSSSTTPASRRVRSEEHTSELQSRRDLVCRLLLEKKKYNDIESEANLKTNNRSTTYH